MTPMTDNVSRVARPFWLRQFGPAFNRKCDCPTVVVCTMPGHCRRGRACAPGDPFASKRALAAFMRGKRVTWEAVTRDRYGRSVGFLRAGGANASCAMLAAGRAVYVARWDTGGLVRKECGRGVR